MKHNTLRVTAVSAAVAGALLAQAAQAGITVYNEGDKYAKIGGRIQLQYHQVDPDGGEKTDQVFFRRFRPYIAGSLHKHWTGKFQWDMGDAEDTNEMSIKDAYLQYKGDAMKVTIGNANFPFSRELLTSSKKQGLVERTFVGDHNYGTPDRNTGVHLSGKGGPVAWFASLASADIDPDSEKLDFDTPVNSNGDFNQGWMVGGRIDIQPMGKLKYAQGDFKRDPKFAVGLAAFSWSNDDDNNSRTDAVTGLDTSGGSRPDVSKLTGSEIDLAFRGFGLSVDAEYNLFKAETVDGTVTSGLYENGEATVKNYALEAGFMAVPATLEIVAGYQGQDADTYTDTWIRQSVGANWYIHKHDIKVQLTYRQSENVDGVTGADQNELFLQTQYVF